MGKLNNTAKGGWKAPGSHSPTLSSCVGEAGHTCDVVQDLRDEVALLEEALFHMGTSSQMPFQFTQCDGSPLEQSLFWSIKVIPQETKTRCTIASTLE